jgi:hypothetical protein
MVSFQRIVDSSMLGQGTTFVAESQMQATLSLASLQHRSH